MRAKLGFATQAPGDDALALDLLARMAEGRADFTQSFRALSGPDPRRARDHFIDPGHFDPWFDRWQARLASEARPEPARIAAMQATNPARIPRNHRIEQAIAAAITGDFGPFERLMAALADPFVDDPAFAAYADPPAEGEAVTATFCGT